MIFQGDRKLESLVNIQENRSFFSLILSSTILERPSHRTMGSKLCSIPNIIAQLFAAEQMLVSKFILFPGFRRIHSSL